MRSIFLIFVSGCCLGCGIADDPYMRELKNSLRITGEEVVAKQDESLVILKSNTNALAAIKSQVESLSGSVLETRQAVGTMNASLVKTEAVNAKEVIKSAEPQEAPRANLSHPIIPVAPSPAVRSFGPLKLSWNVEGNWQPSILETAKHLREDHGIIADGLTHQQMHDMHAAAHEGRKVANKSQPVQFINRGSQCPNGQCPQPRRGLFGRRR
jgi:hypothetical protein